MHSSRTVTSSLPSQTILIALREGRKGGARAKVGQAGGSSKAHIASMSARYRNRIMLSLGAPDWYCSVMGAVTNVASLRTVAVFPLRQMRASSRPSTVQHCCASSTTSFPQRQLSL